MLGREAAYTGKEVTWDKLLKSKSRSPTRRSTGSRSPARLEGSITGSGRPGAQRVHGENDEREPDQAESPRLRRLNGSP